MSTPTEIEAHQYTGSVLSLNALQLWLLSGQYKEVDDPYSEKYDTGYVYAMLDNGQVTQLEIRRGDWVILDNGRFFRSASIDHLTKNQPIKKTA